MDWILRDIKLMFWHWSCDMCQVTHWRTWNVTAAWRNRVWRDRDRRWRTQRRRWAVNYSRLTRVRPSWR